LKPATLEVVGGVFAGQRLGHQAPLDQRGGGIDAGQKRADHAAIAADVAAAPRRRKRTGDRAYARGWRGARSRTISSERGWGIPAANVAAALVSIAFAQASHAGRTRNGAIDPDRKIRPLASSVKLLALGCPFFSEGRGGRGAIPLSTPLIDQLIGAEQLGVAAGSAGSQRRKLHAV